MIRKLQQFREQNEDISVKTDFTLCRLPEFTEEEKSLIKGTGDFFALNMYSTSIIEHKEFPHEVDWDYLTDRKLEESVDPSWQKGNFVFQFIVLLFGISVTGSNKIHGFYVGINKDGGSVKENVNCK